MKQTDYSFDSISSMISSEDSFRTLLDIIGDMDLEILDAQSFRM